MLNGTDRRGTLAVHSVPTGSSDAIRLEFQYCLPMSTQSLHRLPPLRPVATQARLTAHQSVAQQGAGARSDEQRWRAVVSGKVVVV